MARKYDRELGKITERDLEYAGDLVTDLNEAPRGDRIRVASEWLRKVRYEAVMADRNRR